MKLTTTLAVAGMLAIGGIAAGCGGGGDSSTSTSSLTKPEWIAKADAICQGGNQAINQASNQQFPKNSKPTQAQIQQFTTDTVLPSVQSQVDQIKALGAPSGDEAQVNTLLSTVQADIDNAKSNPTAADQGKAFADGNALAKQYGLKVCGKG